MKKSQQNWKSLTKLLHEYRMTFSDFVDQEQAKLALILNAILPDCGGLLLVGKRGTGKSTLLKAFKNIVQALNIPFVELPMNSTEEAVLGGIDIEETVKQGRRIYQKGLVSKAHGGFLMIEDINLFPNDILSLIFEVQSRGENIIEREGITLKEPAKFQILATMNPEEGDFSAHFLDRFGMCVIMDEIKDKNKRIEIVKLNLDCADQNKDFQLIERILKSKEFIKQLRLSDEIKEYIAELTLKEAVSGHRADIFLMYASKAYAAYKEEKEIRKEHVDRVAPLVFIHRKRQVENPQTEEKEQEQKRKENTEERGNKENKPKHTSSTQFSEQGSPQERPSSEKEEVFPVGDSFKVKRILLKKDRILREAYGRRTKTKIKGRGGRFVRSLMQKREDIAISATLRAAAPFQKVRGRKDKLIIKDQDLRYKEKERKMSHIVIFVVDASGSMGVEQRMIQTKGAILSLLMDCYQKRDKVAMIVFRKDRAEVVLPPTSSHDLALKRLKQIPTGGKTPLSAGLMEAYKLIKRTSLKEPEARFLMILVTDGKANVPIAEKSSITLFEEVRKICSTLKNIPKVDFVVVDTEKKNKFIKIDMALKIAEWLSGKYFKIDTLTSENLVEIVNFYKID
ncbi:VWA domain-containing protein [Thermodesulfobacterium thermophilum]|uniref:VWA domain-containing protein n=1 Tax=Thermodesulfobacterium thermophilum TaxID=886 RepID=UPI00138B07CA|nr:VWA domain-containing protein [Thermodesulfobacterium thermophilum]